MAEDRGFIKINRKILENWLWEGQFLDKGRAWIDLLLVTQYKDGSFYGKKGYIEYKRGDCTLSLSDLAKRWGWSRDKVRNFLNILEKEEMIKRKLIKGTYSIITILNYDKYQGNYNVKDINSNKKTKNDEKTDADYDKSLRFLLGDEYDEYMAEKAKKGAKNG